ncbi:cysteine proteinase [Rhizoclosmatium globosum]|uniref:ubiquitinyl hydrolase 1 n=1 Tax=Rhizoclosmatium globosum TaxID=329046 RepID=A0A1Y2CB43_9FUNG|nr:cysteine proteinase [Rhizoclosmatium globosum]|eukprot:ORY44117.1 cysteine proteinase [Rhizoclosmatium globosum]
MQQTSLSDFFESKAASGSSKASEGDGSLKTLFLTGFFWIPANLCNPSKCKTNPNCLRCFSLAKWSANNAKAAFIKIANRSLDSNNNVESLERKGNLPIGLKNLAATCYLNTLLQLWFHTVPFRAAVYQYQMGLCDQNADAIIRNLQVVFAYMQYGSKNVYDPRQFVDSLKIDSGIQQDAQETLRYTTTCKTCKTSNPRSEPFRDLELSITEKGTLADSLSSTYLSHEHLDDPKNLWFCSDCNAKQPATRDLRLEKLPPILNIQLLRFVYDVEKQTKRKVKTSIAFPERLDMARYCERGGVEDSEDGKYVLTGALLHKGSSAYAGHFIARIRDPGSGDWFTLNDETVTREVDVGFEVVETGPAVEIFEGDEEDDEVVVVGESVGKRKRGKEKEKARVEKRRVDDTSDGDGGKIFTSSVAYMLIYTRESDQDALAKEFEEMKNLRLTLVTKGQVSSNDEPSYYVDSDSLREWFREGVVPPDDEWEDVKELEGDKGKEPETEGSKPLVATIKEFDNTDLVCEHGKLNFRKMNGAKRISVDAAEMLMDNGFSFNPKLTQDDFCEDCAESVLGERKSASSHLENLAMFKEAQQAQDSPDECWVSSTWLNEFQKKNPNFKDSNATMPSPTSDPYLGHVLCPHGNLSMNIRSRTLITQQEFNILKLILNNELELLPKIDRVECGTCKGNHEQLIQDKTAMREKAAFEKAKLKKLADMKGLTTTIGTKLTEFYIVSGAFIEKWRRFLKDPNQVDPPGEIDNKVFLCEHSNLSFDPFGSDGEKSPFKFAILNESDWDYLHEWYDTNLIIEGTKKAKPDGGAFIKLYPEVCGECKLERFRSKKDVLIKIRNISESSSPPAAKKLASEKEDENEDGPVDLTESPQRNGKRKAPASSFQSASNVTPARQSRRLQEKKWLEFRLDKSKSVLDLKTYISDKWSVPPIHQQLYLRGQELTINNLKIEALEIDPSDVFEVKLLTEKKSWMFDDDEMGRTGQSKEMGFAGSNLLGFGNGVATKGPDADVAMNDARPLINDEDEEMERVLQMSMEGLKDWSCSSCTFNNGAHENACSMCGTVRL